jgi:hypothetical protein
VTDVSSRLTPGNREQLILAQGLQVANRAFPASSMRFLQVIVMQPSRRFRSIDWPGSPAQFAG